MKVKFRVRETLYADIDFEIECEEPTQVEEALDKIGECVDSDELMSQLCDIFGYGNVHADGLNDTDSIYPAEECEFEDWLDENEDE